ncbi:class F sortase [Microlunatus elymi]|uniref:Class F sortase n=1 Tax=Microlunatus elymi TaxID=2596828 RepID=A0A516PW51_9ACTN|nr:class F sortase [Microlunatus elymi]QDP95417.1 class F sortase [Microlunatus elymi]
MRSGALRSNAQQVRHSWPVRLQVPSIAMDLRVVPVGVDADGFLAMPDTTQRAWWYRFGSRPGDRSGATVLAGHVDTFNQGLGPFSRLVAVPLNAKVVITDSAGHKINYVVKHRQRFAKKTTDFEQIFTRTGPPVLRLMTCAPPYRTATGYQDLLIVTAVPQ